MLIEFKHVRQEPGPGRRRWFMGDHFELVVWYGADGPEIRGFQVIYRKRRQERALTWRTEDGFQHTRVDTGSQPPQANLTPILVPTGADIPWGELLGEFDARSGLLEPELREFVRLKLEARG